MDFRKQYTTFDDIDKDLEILKIERDLSYHKMRKELAKTKESFELKNLIGSTPTKILSFLSALSGPLKSLALTFLFKKIFK